MTLSPDTIALLTSQVMATVAEAFKFLSDAHAGKLTAEEVEAQPALLHQQLLDFHNAAIAAIHARFHPTGVVGAPLAAEASTPAKETP